VTEAVLRDGRAETKDVEDVELLARLLAVRDAALREPPRRWPLPVALFASLVLVSLLMVMRVPETSVVLRAAVDGVCFTSAGEQPVLQPLNVAALGVAGLHDVVLPRTRTVFSERTLEASSVHLAVDNGNAGGSVTLAVPAVAAGRRVCVRYPTTSSALRLSLAGPSSEIRADARGTVRLAAAGSVETLDLPSPQPVLLRPGQADVDLDIEVRTPNAAVFSAPIAVDGVALVRTENTFNSSSDRTTVRTVSAVRSGTIEFPSLDGVRRSLRSGDALSFGSAKGELIGLGPKDDHLEMEFVGRVRGLVTGTDGARSLMPTWFEWIQARHGLSLLWGSVVYVFGMVLLILRWFKFNL
jgi:hypothetical protein